MYRTSRNSRFQWTVFGGLSGAMISILLGYFLPRTYESSVTVELGKAPDQLKTRMISDVQALHGFTNGHVLNSAAEMSGLIGKDGISAKSLLLKTVYAEKIPNTDLIKVVACHSDGAMARKIVGNLVECFDAEYTADFKTRALKDLGNDTDEVESKRVRRSALKSELDRLLPEYFQEHMVRCRSGSDEANAENDAQETRYVEKRKLLEQTHPGLPSLIEEYEALNRFVIERDRFSLIPQSI